MKLISFEGSDYSGKTTTSKYLSQKTGLVYNSGNIYCGQELEFYKEISKNCNELQREAIYTAMFFLDKEKTNTSDKRIILQDRYWMSVVAYGRFLNGSQSLHHNIDVSRFMIKPDLVIYLKCSYEEKLKRSAIRKSKSVLDKYFLKDPCAVNRLENEIEQSVRGQNILSIDTTNIAVEEVANIIGKKIKEEIL